MGKKIIINVLLSVVCIALFGLYAFNATQLAAAQDEIAATQTNLTTTQANLALTNSNLDTANVQLTQTQSDLKDTKNELTDITEQLEAVSSQLSQTKADYNDTLALLNEEKTSAARLETTISNLQANLSSLTTGYGYVYRDPTYAEAKAFLTSDRTDANLYVLDTYVCEDFAYDVVTHALQLKLRCAFVSIRFPVFAHAIIAFNTTDRGLVYFEAQSDEEVRLQTGKHYWTQCVIAAGSGYLPSSYDDTVERFNVIW
jgi:hypothetical protein